MKSISLGLADDHPLMLAGLVDLFRLKDEFEVVATGSSADDVLQIALQTAPDVFIVDIVMPGNIFSTILDLIKRGCKTRFLAFSAMSKSEIAIKALGAGASGYVLKGTTTQELVDAIRAVQRGEIFLSQELACKLIEHHRMSSLKVAAGPPVKFSLREGQIIAMLTRGCTNRQIALELKIGEKTVKNHMTALMQKLNVRNRLEVLIATQNLDQDELPMPRH